MTSAKTDQISVERQALKDAAEHVSKIHWPEPQAAGWSARLAGVVSGSKSTGVTRKDAIDAYLLVLASSDDPTRRLVSDAETQLRAADAMANAAEDAAFAQRPSMSDVAIVEAAIGDLREARDIYIASAKVVAATDAEKDAIVAALKTDYARAITEIGQAADLIADRVASDRTRTIAQPRASGANYFGSL
ncbi:MAG: hypothetical protein AAGJ87_10230 [Pseudomonadota bacterium]